MNIDSLVNISLLQHEVAVMRSQYAYKQLFFFFYKPVTRFAMTVVPSKEEAEEIYQDVMLKIWDLGEHLAEIKDLRAYLLTITRNTAINYLHKYHKTIVIEFTEKTFDQLYDSIDPEQVLLFGELKDVIEEAVRILPPQCRMVYHLVREKGLSYKETAQVLDISVKTAERHMTIALQKLMRAVQDYRKAHQQ